eukprot:CAMPEP_0115082426 /NCGR_PEP_ID=MMETSP0227-20121206/19896_1 /TAXON_ID=89957 /ORGANISM="Polarella glacialis, Strain CCMP 1383" /LENGTH=36 /DNA_ID= /DNA_START= /DNA_END= /DNA_ORIENTATION=
MPMYTLCNGPGTPGDTSGQPADPGDTPGTPRGHPGD